MHLFHKYTQLQIPYYILYSFFSLSYQKSCSFWRNHTIITCSPPSQRQLNIRNSCFHIKLWSVNISQSFTFIPSFPLKTSDKKILPWWESNTFLNESSFKISNLWKLEIIKRNCIENFSLGSFFVTGFDIAC